MARNGPPTIVDFGTHEQLTVRGFCFLISTCNNNCSNNHWISVQTLGPVLYMNAVFDTCTQYHMHRVLLCNQDSLMNTDGAACRAKAKQCKTREYSHSGDIDPSREYTMLPSYIPPTTEAT